MKVLMRGVLVLVGVWAVLLMALYLFQERLLFFPVKLPADFQFRFPQAFEELRIDAPDDASIKLHALHLKNPQPKGLIFYLHGNGGNVDSWTAGHEFYRRMNYDLVMLDYRGYGKSNGKNENEAQMHADVNALWTRVAPKYVGKPIVVFGRSLGTGLAARLAVDAKPALTILVSPYRSIRAMAQTHYPFVPGFVLKYHLDTEAIIDQIKTPLLIVHGERDTLIPVDHSMALASKHGAAELITLPNADHVNVHEDRRYLEVIEQRLNNP